ncbi:preprotein translocase subunit SecB [Mariprofundus micogutta]|uniref:Preprotein translocase subunit SecB n=1 Tax=Mariprofundus micogutta TaxID=1921010 RepID=A0A1L8CLU8_9PROT|nr:protein-export chaperone SecB [Mariprofundus micogutta]GAV19876.1 preprotein translocase subunit SecB [Mariprofundus micogutta]
MTEIATTPTDDTPVFSLQKLYIKDISFENPNAPMVFTIQNPQPNIEMNMKMENRQIDEDHWEVSLKASIVARDTEQDNQVRFEIEVEQAGLFYLKNIPEEHIDVLINVDCPTMIFPYTRQIISQLTVDGGFMPLLLDPINFAAAYEVNRKQQTKH